MSFDLILIGTSFAASFFLKKYLETARPDARILVLERGIKIPHKQRLEQTRMKPRNKVTFVTGGDTEKTFRNSTPSKPWLFDPSFGGSSNSWTGCTPRLMPNDFRLRSAYGVGSDWPISYDELEPFYCDVEQTMAISGPDRMPYPMSRPFPQPAHRLSSVDEIMKNAYGDLYVGQPTARSSIQAKRNLCCTSAVCNLCPTNAKFTIENGLAELYGDPRVDLLTESQVIRLETRQDTVDKVVYVRDGKEQQVKGEAIAMAANPIFNSHILLNSGDDNPATGRYLSEQVGFPVYVYLHDLANVGGSSFITANGYMLYDGADRAKHAGCLIENHNGFLLRHEHGRWRSIALFKFVFEDIPQEHNYVSVSEDTALPVVTYKGYSDYVRRGYSQMKRSLEKLLSPLPVEKIYIDENPVRTEGHILGTTRMSNDPANGVIDRHLMHHRYRNLFVLGASAFPSISPSNPTLTVSALSLWAAHHAYGSATNA